MVGSRGVKVLGWSGGREKKDACGDGDEEGGEEEGAEEEGGGDGGGGDDETGAG